MSLSTMPSSPNTTEIIVGPQGKINEGTEQVVHEGTSNWVKVTHAKSIVEYGRNLDGHLMF